MPGQGMIPEVMRWRPQQDSNLRSRLRRALIVTPVTWGNDPVTSVLGCGWGAADGRGPTRRPAAGGRGGPLRPEAKFRRGLPAPQHAWPGTDRPWVSAGVHRCRWRLSLTSSLSSCELPSRAVRRTT